MNSSGPLNIIIYLAQILIIDRIIGDEILKHNLFGILQ